MVIDCLGIIYFREEVIAPTRRHGDDDFWRSITLPLFQGLVGGIDRLQQARLVTGNAELLSRGTGTGNVAGRVIEFKACIMAGETGSRARRLDGRGKGGCRA